MARVSLEVAGGRNVLAFLDTIATAEGTSTMRESDDGYNVLVGGTLFESYVDHPRRFVYLPGYRISSSAAGRYQFLKNTWTTLAKRLRLPDFGPVSQDLAAIELLRETGALTCVQVGDLAGAIARCQHVWASLPGAGYGQRELPMQQLRDAYAAAGGELAPGSSEQA